VQEQIAAPSNAGSNKPKRPANPTLSIRARVDANELSKSSKPDIGAVSDAISEFLKGDLVQWHNGSVFMPTTLL